MLEQDRLRRCGQCGELRGEALVDDQWQGKIYVPVICLCGGIVCRYCRNGAIRRPISDRYDEATGKIFHMPYFGGLIPCRACKAAARAEHG